PSSRSAYTTSAWAAALGRGVPTIRSPHASARDEYPSGSHAFASITARSASTRFVTAERRFSHRANASRSLTFVLMPHLQRSGPGLDAHRERLAVRLAPSPPRAATRPRGTARSSRPRGRHVGPPSDGPTCSAP